MVKFRKRLLVAALSLTAVTNGALGAAMISSVSGSADEAGKEVNPIAKYEFKDTSNIGKDSMGKYDLTFRNAWKAGGTGDLLNEYTAIEGGGITFNNKLCLAADKDKNVFKDTSAVTMVLEVKMVSGSGTPLGRIGHCRFSFFESLSEVAWIAILFLFPERLLPRFFTLFLFFACPFLTFVFFAFS